MGMFGGYPFGGRAPLKVCQAEGCTNQFFAWEPFVHCKDHREVTSAVPEDPEAEAKAELFEQFRELRFTEGEARALADAWADPVRVSWWLEQGCGHRRAVQIAT